MGLVSVWSVWKTTKAMRYVGLKVGVVVEEDPAPAGAMKKNAYWVDFYTISKKIKKL